MMLILISPEKIVALEHEILQALFNEGLQYFHLRKPSFNNIDTKAYIEKLAVENLPKIALHYNHKLAEEYALGGIHYPAANIGNIDKEQHSNNLRVSFSAHSLTELNSVKKSVNYAFISPVFNSISKENYNANPNFIDLIMHHLRIPIIALGGITEQGIKKVREMGFSGVAVLGDIWQLADNKHSIKEVVARFKQLQKACTQ